MEAAAIWSSALSTTAMTEPWRHAVDLCADTKVGSLGEFVQTLRNPHLSKVGVEPDLAWRVVAC